MFERIKNIVMKEFIQAFRDKIIRFVLFVTPIIQLMMFGYVVTTDVNHISTAFYDLDHSYESRELARRLESSGYFQIRHTPSSPKEISSLLDTGEILCAIQINRGFSKDLKKGNTSKIQIIVDGSDSNTATIALNYGSTIISKYAQDISLSHSKTGLGKIDFRTRVWYNPDLRSRNYNVPGVIASIIMLTCLMLTSMAIVREREIGTMEQLMVTPIKPIELMMGKTIPFAAIGFLDMLLVTAVGLLWFDIPMKGSFPLLLLGTSVYLLSVLGIGLFISTISKTQQQALMVTFLFNMPALLLSGFTFPIENMPKIFQYITYVNPFRYFLIIIRGIFLKGNGIHILWPEMATLLVLGIFIISASALRFHKRLV
jgi:ABC-2 type transport system permease protein